LKQKPPGEELRLNPLDVMKRKVRALQAVAADQVGAVFNQSEIAAIRRLAKGEHIRNAEMTQEEAVRELAWVKRGGRYPDDPDLEDEDGA